jgi:hypothetical protein
VDQVLAAATALDEALEGAGVAGGERTVILANLWQARAE